MKRAKELIKEILTGIWQLSMILACYEDIRGKEHIKTYVKVLKARLNELEKVLDKAIGGGK